LWGAWQNGVEATIPFTASAGLEPRVQEILEPFLSNKGSTPLSPMEKYNQVYVLIIIIISYTVKKFVSYTVSSHKYGFANDCYL
jgi:hypothetical protein